MNDPYRDPYNDPKDTTKELKRSPILEAIAEFLWFLVVMVALVGMGVGMMLGASVFLQLAAHKP